MTKQATCIEEGYSLYYCPDCGEDYTIDIPGLADHQYWSVYSVFSKDGELIEDHVQCSICGHEDILYFNGGSDTPTVTNGNTLPGWTIALIVIAAILAVGGVATGIALRTTKHCDAVPCTDSVRTIKAIALQRWLFLMGQLYKYKGNNRSDTGNIYGGI